MENYRQVQSVTLSKDSLKTHLTEVTSLSKVLAALIFIILPFVGFYLGFFYQSLQAPKQTELISTTKIDLLETTPQLKKTFLGGQIPTTWSEYYFGESAWIEDNNVYDLNTITYSIASDRVSFGDISWQQIDFRFITENAGEDYLKNVNEMATTDTEVMVSEVLLDDIYVTVVTWPLDNGEATKGGPGGKTYIVKLSKNENHPGYLLIDKQALGDANFEKDFAHFIESVDFKKLSAHMWFEYANMPE